MLGKTAEMVLLFRGSRDGWKHSNFHSKCDNQGPTITFIKTSLGRLCGGFTPLPWDSTTSGAWKQDFSKQAFLFSLDSQTVYPLTDPSLTIYCASANGPLFGNGQNLSAGYTSKDLNTPNVSHCVIGNNYSIPGDANGNSVLTG